MTSRHVIPVSLLAALVVVGGLAKREAGQCASAGIPVSSVAAAKSIVVAKSAPTEAKATARARVVAAMRSEEHAVLPSRLNPEEGALLAEQVAVQLLVKDAALDLSPEQWSAFAAVTWHYQTVRQTFEATIATVSARDKFRLEIPAYPAAGDVLREKFYGELRERLGEGPADAIAGRAGAALEGYFGGFGVSVQTLDFAPNAGVTGTAGADYLVTRTARYWNSTDAREKLTLRRETHFSGQEDPNGERWGPYLALLATGGTELVGN